MTRRTLLAAGAAAPQDFPPDIFDNRFQDPAVLYPDVFHAEFDNPMARAVRVKLAPDQRVRGHDMRAGTVVALTEVHVRFTRMVNGKSHDVHMEPGQVRFLYADTHALLNLSPRRAEYFLVEVKEPGRANP
jgi:hypothetical protein